MTIIKMIFQEKLKNYLTNYKYCMEVGDEKGAKVRYYWIPLEDLP